MWAGRRPSRGSRGEFVPASSSFRCCYIPWLVVALSQSPPRGHLAFSCSVLRSPSLSHKDICDNNQDPPPQSWVIFHHKIFDLLTSAKNLFPKKTAFTGSRHWDLILDLEKGLSSNLESKVRIGCLGAGSPRRPMRSASHTDPLGILLQVPKAAYCKPMTLLEDFFLL